MSRALAKAMVVGAGGQLGRSLVAAAPPGIDLVALGSDQLDITDREAVARSVTLHSPDVLFNAAAYTAVDKAEQDEAAALAVNGAAVGHLADAAHSAGAQLVHVSTDFVFDGRQGMPYTPAAPTAPLGAYGRTKLAGELAAGAGALIVRTAWVYAPTGGNFVRTMLRLMVERSEVRVVADQIGTPTYAPGLASALWVLAAQGAQGIHHYTDSGAASWYDFAVAIEEEAQAAGLIDWRVAVVPITAAEYPTPARRPHYSVLDKTATFAALGQPAPHWRVNLRAMIEAIRIHG